MPKHFPPNPFTYKPVNNNFQQNHCDDRDRETPTCSKYISRPNNQASTVHTRICQEARPYTHNIPTPRPRYTATLINSNNCSMGVYVTQLHQSIVTSDLQEIFSKAGPIRKCFVATDKSTGKSLCYGVIHYMSVESAQTAIRIYNGFIIKGQEINVEAYKSPEEREPEKPFINLFVKNFQGGITSENEFVSMFLPYGTITSYKIERDAITGEIKGYGYICFAQAENAKLAMQSLNGFMLKNYKMLFVGKHKTKEQIQNSGRYTGTIANSYQNMPFHNGFRLPKENEGFRRFHNGLNVGLYTNTGFRCETYIPAGPRSSNTIVNVIPRNNIYVKNLKGFVDTNNDLFDLFKHFGFIISAVIMRDEITKLSRGFGFVCFKNVSDAYKAISEMNNSRLPNGKLLFCGYAQGKDERQAQLRLKFRENVNLQRQQCIERRKRNGLSSSATFLETLCNICFDEKPPSESVLLDCKHVNCKDCLRDWFNILIMEKQINFICPGENCQTPIVSTLIKTLVSKDTFEKYDKVLLECALESMDDVIHCPAPGCDSWIVLDPIWPTRGACTNCNLLFCTNCTNAYHGLEPCDEFLNEEDKEAVLTNYANGTVAIKTRLEKRYGKEKLDKELETRMNNLFLNQNCKKCPSCKSNIEKNGGCNHMHCWKCNNHFCWICFKQFSNAGEAYNHVRVGNCS